MKNNFSKSKQANFNGQQGFTLVELLLVMAIIGILAGIISVGIGAARKNANVTAALKTANNINVELADCYLRSKTVLQPVVGGQICPGAGKWPELNKKCAYKGITDGYTLTVTCNAGQDQVVCSDSKCEKSKTTAP